ncbi:MAG TPA: DUF948 domain-containing protein [Gemmatimonadaceae bacterium]
MPMINLMAQINAVATAIIAVVLCVFLVGALAALWQLRKAYQRVKGLLDRVYADLTPLIRNTTTISDNVVQVTNTIRDDIRNVSTTIETVNKTMRDAMASTEQRVQDFNALLAVAQEEAEQLFLSTASTVRGVQRSAEALRDPDGTDLASEELDAAIEPDDFQEEGDGDDSSSESAAQTRPTAPRVRPRAGNRRRA